MITGIDPTINMNDGITEKKYDQSGRLDFFCSCTGSNINRTMCSETNKCNDESVFHFDNLPPLLYIQSQSKQRIGDFQHGKETSEKTDSIKKTGRT